MSNLFIEYPKCTTCRKARKWLEEQGAEFTGRHIAEQAPTADEIRAWSAASGLPLKKFFNTSGMQYRALELKDKLPAMTIEDQLQLATERLQWAMNECLATIGIHSPKHRKRAIEIGERLGVLKDYPTPPYCTSPYAPAWIEEMVSRQKA